MKKDHMSKKVSRQISEAWGEETGSISALAEARYPQPAEHVSPPEPQVSSLSLSGSLGTSDVS